MSVGTQVTVYLRKDELVAIQQILDKYKGEGLNRHAVIKLGIRYFLFPKERSNIPLDGLVAEEKTCPVHDTKYLTFRKEGKLVVT